MQKHSWKEFGLWSGIQTIYPEDIKRKDPDKGWFDIRKNFRKANRKTVQKLARMMTGGSWELNGIPIIVKDDRGQVTDGQHRLLAVCQSNCPLTTVVTVGVGSHFGFDDNRKRTVADELAFRGLKNCNKLQSAAGHIFRARNNTWGLAELNASAVTIIQTFDSSPGLEDFVRLSGNPGIYSVGFLAAFLWLACDGKIEENATYLLEKLKTGEGMSEGDPVLALREFYWANQKRHAKLQPATLWAALIKGWNCLVRGEECNCRSLRWYKFGPNARSFPIPLLSDNSGEIKIG